MVSGALVIIRVLVNFPVPLPNVMVVVPAPVMVNKPVVDATVATPALLLL